MDDIDVKKHEEEMTAFYKDLFNKGKHTELLEEYCHEGVVVRQLYLDVDSDNYVGILDDSAPNYSTPGNIKPTEVYICSYSVITDTAEEGLLRVAYHVLEEAYKGDLGC